MSTKTEAGPVGLAYGACAAICEAISEEYQRSEGRNYPELKSDAETGAAKCADAIRAALTAHPPAQEQPAPVVPPGWKLVPEVPTVEMNRAAYDAFKATGHVGSILSAMLAAAPTHPTPAERAEQPLAEQELRELLARSVAGAALYADDGELQDSSELPAIDFKRDAPGEIARKLTDRGLTRLTKPERVHALVNDGPWPGMSEAFDAHMGAACWTDPAYRQDAATWAAAWKASKRAGQPPRDAVQQEPGKMMLTLQDLQALAFAAERNGTHAAFQAVALEWCGKAHEEIARLRTTLKGQP